MQNMLGPRLKQALSGYVLDTPCGELGLFEGTVVALQAADPHASNYEILCGLHREYQKWASALPSTARWTTQHLARSFRHPNLAGIMGRYEDVRHGYVAH